MRLRRLRRSHCHRSAGRARSHLMMRLNVFLMRTNVEWQSIVETSGLEGICDSLLVDGRRSWMKMLSARYEVDYET